MIFPSRSQLASKQITRTGRARAVTKEGINATLLQHVSPIEWDNVILYGQSVLGKAKTSDRTRDVRCVAKLLRDGGYSYDQSKHLIAEARRRPGRSPRSYQPNQLGQRCALRGVQAPTRAGRDGKRLSSTVYGYTNLFATLIGEKGVAGHDGPYRAARNHTGSFAGWLQHHLAARSNSGFRSRNSKLGKES